MKLQIIQTVKDTAARLSSGPVQLFEEDKTGYEGPQIVLFPELSFQTIEGFGGAFTEAASTTLDQLDADKRQEILRDYFDPVDGIGYSLCRTHIQSCDFSLSNYSYIEEGDESLSTFSLERDQKSLLPMIQEAQRIGSFRLLASPWSPPAFMKDNGERNHGGKLLPQYYALWASLIERYIEAYRALDVPIWAITVQNEPKAVQTWDSCIFTAEEERDFVKHYLGEKMQRQGVGIFVWDHNKERLFERADTILRDKEAAAYVAGAAFHWYSGDHFEQLDLLQHQYPDKKLLFSEGCYEYSLGKGLTWEIGERYGHDIIGDINHGCCAFIDWNLLLNQDGGPNHVGNFCDAPIMANTQTGEITRHNSYYYIGHFSKFVRPGAQRIGMSRWSDCVDASALRNPDGTIVLVVLNRSEQSYDFSIRIGHQICKTVSQPRSMATYLINN